MEREKIAGNNCGNACELVQTVLLTFSVTLFFYWIYFLLAPWIWSQNTRYSPEFITPWIQEASATEYDGVEIYALYIMMFLNTLAAFTLSSIIAKKASVTVKYILIVAGLACSVVLFANIGFTPPMSELHKIPLLTVAQKSLPILLADTVLLALMLYLQTKASRWLFAVAAIVLFPVCFIAISPISRFDYSYVFTPALRLIRGTAIHDIYFQYELLPSLLAAFWMKLGLELNDFQIIGQLAFFTAIMGVFLFSGKLFQKRELSVFLFLALLLTRTYATPWEIGLCFQVTPIRLDLWLPLLVVVYLRGPYHWMAGAFCGILLLLLKNFGIIYTMAYIQLLLTLYAIRYLDRDRGAPFLSDLTDYGKKCFMPLAIIMVSFAASYFLFRNSEYANYSGYYQKIGIGFIPIATNSFYWYIPAMISAVFIMLFRMRHMVSAPYLTCGFLLVHCAIGNSIYFFGRSHEHNIINISIVLLLLFFLMLDLFSRSLHVNPASVGVRAFLQRHVTLCAAAAIILIISVFYCDNIHDKVSTQISNVAKGQMIYPSDIDQRAYSSFMNRLKTVTGSSRKVYFVAEADFELYYYGDYTPVGYCSPLWTWIFAKDLNHFLQGLLENGYYLVFSDKLKYLMSNLHYSRVDTIGKSVVVTKLPLPALTPKAMTYQKSR